MISALAFDNQLATMPIEPNDVNVLILDDSQFDRIRIRRMFEKIGIRFHLSEIESLDELSESLDSKKFDVVLIDFQLPKGDGLEVLKRIQEHKCNYKAATVMIAGDDQSQVAVRAMKSGCWDYIAKETLDTHRLRTLILSVVDAAEASAAKADEFYQRIEVLIARLKDHHASALQPKVIEIIQDIRSLRARVYQPHSPLAQELAVVEKRCLGLWSSLKATEAVALAASSDVGLN